MFAESLWIIYVNLCLTTFSEVENFKKAVLYLIMKELFVCLLIMYYLLTMVEDTDHRKESEVFGNYLPLLEAT